MSGIKSVNLNFRVSPEFRQQFNLFVKKKKKDSPEGEKMDGTVIFHRAIRAYMAEG
jgi:hypothetical protein